MLEHLLILEYDGYIHTHKRYRKYPTNQYDDNERFYIDGLQNLLQSKVTICELNPSPVLIHRISFSNQYLLIEKWLLPLFDH